MLAPVGPEPEASCRCCGVRIGPGPRVAIRRCIVCDMCDRRHGDELQIHVMSLLRAGQLEPGHALARMMFDDAHLAGMLEVRRPDPDRPEVHPWVIAAVPRWRVVVGRALARDELPDIGLMVRVALARYLGQRNTAAVRAEISRELTEAMVMVDPNVLSVEVSTEAEMLDPEGIRIELTARTARPGMMTVGPGAEDVDIPDDIMLRPRGQA